MRVDQVQQFAAEELGAGAQVGAQVLEGLMPLAERGEVGAGVEVWGEEVGAREGKGVGEGGEVGGEG